MPLNVPNINPNLPKILKAIPDKSNEKLIVLWHNSLEYPNRSDGNLVRDAIEKNWAFRSFYTNQKTNGSSPEKGLLSALGYRVGSVRGKKKILRQLILERVYKAQLPLVYCKAYMTEWGSPASSSRETKLTNVLNGFIESKRGDLSFNKAISSLFLSPANLSFNRYW